MIHDHYASLTPTDDELLALDSEIDWESLIPLLQRFGKVVRRVAQAERMCLATPIADVQLDEHHLPNGDVKIVGRTPDGREELCYANALSRDAIQGARDRVVGRLSGGSK